ncbi:hypothetical protein V8B97DRAFT_1935899 [Scleroderma yunnanense]
MLSSIEKQRAFLSFPRFAVVGASTDQAKWGNKILRWYIARNKLVTPVHPTVDKIESINTARNMANLLSPTETGYCHTTEAKELSIPAIWIQPGASDVACVNFIKENGMENQVLWEGECLWRDGDGVLVQAML